MFYQTDCHRDHRYNPTWVSYRLKEKKQLDDGFKASYCLFGLHQLPTLKAGRDSANVTIAVVESEKTAVICSEYYPQLLWMATGGLSFLNTPMLAPLKGHHVILFPDTDPEGKTFQKWAEITAQANDELHTQFAISNILERHATPDQKARKIDIADYIIENRM